MVTRRNTKQKKLILNYLQTHHNHPTAEKIYQKLQKSIPNLTLATIYRNLHLLTEETQILTLNINNEFHFDGTIAPHLHLVCKKCHHIDDIMMENIKKKIAEIYQNNHFIAQTNSYISYGYCKKCHN